MTPHHSGPARLSGDVVALGAAVERARKIKKMNRREAEAQLGEERGWMYALERRSTDHRLPAVVSAAVALDVSVDLFASAYVGAEFPEQLPRPLRSVQLDQTLTGEGGLRLGRWTRIAREAGGLSRADVGAREGISPRYLGELERGGIAGPQLTTVLRVSRALTALRLQPLLFRALVLLYAGEIEAVSDKLIASENVEAVIRR